MRRDEVLDILRTHEAELRGRFGIASLALFGSVARDEAGPGSDVDVLVELGEHPMGLFRWLELREYLEGLLGSRVDLGTADALKRPLREQVLREAVRAL